MDNTIYYRMALANNITQTDVVMPYIHALWRELDEITEGFDYNFVRDRTYVEDLKWHNWNLFTPETVFQGSVLLYYNVEDYNTWVDAECWHKQSFLFSELCAVTYYDIEPDNNVNGYLESTLTNPELVSTLPRYQTAYEAIE